MERKHGTYVIHGVVVLVVMSPMLLPQNHIGFHGPNEFVEIIPEKHVHYLNCIGPLD